MINTNFDHPPREGCPMDRFLYLTAGYGQHNNHIVAIMNAFVISKALGRTLVIPDFIFMHRKDGQPATLHNKHKYTKRMYERRYVSVCRRIIGSRLSVAASQGRSATRPSLANDWLLTKNSTKADMP